MRCCIKGAQSSFQNSCPDYCLIIKQKKRHNAAGLFFFNTPIILSNLSWAPELHPNPGSDTYGPRIWPRSPEWSVLVCVCGEGRGLLPSPSSFGLIHRKEWSRAETFIWRIQKEKENQEGEIRARWRMKGRRRRLRARRREGGRGKRWGDGWAGIILRGLQSRTWRGKKTHGANRWPRKQEMKWGKGKKKKKEAAQRHHLTD